MLVLAKEGAGLPFRDCGQTLASTEPAAARDQHARVIEAQAGYFIAGLTIGAEKG